VEKTDRRQFDVEPDGAGAGAFFAKITELLPTSNELDDVPRYGRGSMVLVIDH
jgi:hypothetical protein